MIYCSICNTKAARRKITQEMAEKLGMDPDDRACPECFEDLSGKVKS